MDDCGICGWFRSPGTPWMYEDDLWGARIGPGYEVPGWAIVALRRHAEGVGALTADEATSMGPVMTRLARLLASGAEAERVYVLAMGEHAAHWHFLLASRGAQVPDEWRGVELFRHRDELVDAVRAEAVAARVREGS